DTRQQRPALPRGRGHDHHGEHEREHADRGGGVTADERPADHQDRHGQPGELPTRKAHQDSRARKRRERGCRDVDLLTGHFESSDLATSTAGVTASTVASTTLLDTPPIPVTAGSGAPEGAVWRPPD